MSIYEYDAEKHLRMEREDAMAEGIARGKAEGKEVWLPDQQANGQMRSMVGCNCLIEIPAGSGPVKAGDKVEVLWL